MCAGSYKLIMISIAEMFINAALDNLVVDVAAVGIIHVGRTLGDVVDAISGLLATVVVIGGGAGDLMGSTVGRAVHRAELAVSK